MKDSPESHEKMPAHISPMLATLIREPFDDPNAKLKLKLDGYRALTEIPHKNIKLISRNNKLLNNIFPDIIRDLEILLIMKSY